MTLMNRNCPKQLIDNTIQSILQINAQELRGQLIRIMEVKLKSLPYISIYNLRSRETCHIVSYNTALLKRGPSIFQILQTHPITKC